MKTDEKETCMNVSVKRTLVLCMAVAFATMIATWKIATAAGSGALTYIESKTLLDSFGKPGPLRSEERRVGKECRL